MPVLSVLGHVGHGKSALLKHLSGMDPDRRPDEKKRGMTIDLGHVHLGLPLQTVGLIDVPGHQQYLKNLLKALLGVDGFVFVVSALEGWQPQSEEHYRIAKALQKKLGLVVISKCDLVDAKAILHLKKELENRFPGLAIIESSLDQDSKHSILKIIEDIAKKMPSPNGTVKLWVDNVFTPRGENVIATGTLHQGKIAIGMPLYLWPGGLRVRVKSIQAYGNKVEMVRGSSRVALQLAQCKSSDIARGSYLSEEAVPTTKSVDIHFKSWSTRFKRNTQGKVAFGTLEAPAVLVPLSDSLLRIKFKKEYPIQRLDPLILRTTGNEILMGSGTVLDPISNYRKHAEALSQLDQLLNDADYAAYLQRGTKLKSSSTLPKKQDPTKDSRVKLKDGSFLERDVYETFQKKVIGHIKEFQTLKTPDAKTLFQASRKITVLILEKMDEDRVTYLKDGVRRLLRNV